MTDTTSKLCAEIAAYCEANGLKHESADEMAGEIAEQIFNLREVQAITNRNLARLEQIHAWLNNFCERWEVAQAREDMAHTLQREGFGLEVCGGGALMWHRYGESLYAVITGLEGAELRDAGERCTLGIYASDGDGESITEIVCRDLREAIAKAGKLVR